MSKLHEIITDYAHPRTRMWGLLSQPAQPVRRFSDAALQAQVDKVLASLPADTKAAELNIGVDEQGVQVVGVMKLDHGWSILGGVSYDFGGSWGGEIALRRVWK